jgi:hypothetical protein
MAEAPQPIGLDLSYQQLEKPTHTSPASIKISKCQAIAYLIPLVGMLFLMCHRRSFRNNLNYLNANDALDRTLRINVLNREVRYESCSISSNCFTSLAASGYIAYEGCTKRHYLYLGIAIGVLALSLLGFALAMRNKKALKKQRNTATLEVI